MKRIILVLSILLLDYVSIYANFVIIDNSYDVNADGAVNAADIASVVNAKMNSDKGEDAYLKCPDDKHPHLIDLGLPSGTKWACCNVGSDSPESVGGLFAWGETQEKSSYTWSTYAFWHDSEGDGSPEFGQTGIYRNEFEYIKDDIGGSQYDAAWVLWGNQWRIPTAEHFQELLDHTNLNFSFDLLGWQFIGDNGGSILLPLNDVLGGYWTSSPTTDYDDGMMSAAFFWIGYNILPFLVERGNPFPGHFIRAISSSSPTSIEICVSMSRSVTVVARYNIKGQRISEPQPGLNILMMSDGTIRKVIIR